ncbi:MAG TPA: cysteine synthase A [Fermentimonas caenicola]|jgi:cysteine synthase A|uniref:cysteine synthase A n=1 Tax=Lascolabacillus TaxID=1924067 RepID=UPI0006B2F7CC|nr:MULTISPECIES: cysteine synthase A [Lascolabacillus]MBP6175631.1 cysteine synthase A [Fermentimonas sp.]MDI9624960.1 cysteine synthase A [Bacteroidota bacterium]TAH62076.1 MAG: cysteine synthase A [Fermentimonas caenicola]MBP6196599.1 cysteine synthase A [Fermentimonas sp.]MBP7104103.1 cysteine synthase A [Fermentimonas sp.]
MKYNNILETVGNTPHVRLNKLFPYHDVWIKLEKQNPAGSIKDRIALSMIEDAERMGIIKPGDTIIEPTSGNTGVGLAFCGAVKGYNVIIVMPESMSVERRQIISLYGAELVLTPREKGMRGAIEKAGELQNDIPGSWIPQQFQNLSNPKIHAKTTAQEIIKDFPEGIDYLITGIGTGGHITGVGRELKKRFSEIEVIGVEPMDSPIISEGRSGPHSIQGIGAGFIPDTLDLDVLDDVIKVTKEEAFESARKLAREEGIFGGISTGASIAAVIKKIDDLVENKRIITFNYDTGERYLSLDGLFK